MDPLSLLGRALVVFLLLGLTLWLLRRGDGLKGLRRSETPLEVLGSARLGKGASVALVRIGDADYALGVTDQAVSLLTETELPGDDEAQARVTGSARSARPGFPAALQAQLGLLTRRGHGSRRDGTAGSGSGETATAEASPGPVVDGVAPESVPEAGPVDEPPTLAEWLLSRETESLKDPEDGVEPDNRGFDVDSGSVGEPRLPGDLPTRATGARPSRVRPGGAPDAGAGVTRTGQRRAARSRSATRPQSAAA